MSARPFVAFMIVSFAMACGGSSPAPQSPAAAQRGTAALAPSGTVALRLRTPGTRCSANGPLPDPSCTPGRTIAGITRDTICNTSTTGRRSVPGSVHVLVFTEYGYSFPQVRGAFEVDHLIPLELGGDNVIENLWAEAADPKPGFHEKDKVENYLHKEVCAGRMPLAKAQHTIATNWIEVWNKISTDSAAVANDDDDGETE